MPLTNAGLLDPSNDDRVVAFNLNPVAPTTTLGPTRLLILGAEAAPAAPIASLFFFLLGLDFFGAGPPLAAASPTPPAKPPPLLASACLEPAPTGARTGPVPEDDVVERSL